MNMSRKLRILLTNDDGIHASGLKHLWKSLQPYAELYVVAPSTEMSGSSSASTITKPLQIFPTAWDKNTPAWHVNGTPADCVKLAISVILENTPDLIVSGINQGSNSGRNVLNSGTIGAVIEGTMRNIPGIAFSCVDFDDPPFQNIEKYIYPLIQYYFKHPLPKGTFLNVNFPSKSKGEMKGLKMARQGKGYWIEDPAKRLHPKGEAYYWLSGKWYDQEEEEDSDVFLLKQGYITAVPIHVGELTDHSHLNAHKNLFDDFFNKNLDSTFMENF